MTVERCIGEGLNEIRTLNNSSINPNQKLKKLVTDIEAGFCQSHSELIRSRWKDRATGNHIATCLARKYGENGNN